MFKNKQGKLNWYKIGMNYIMKRFLRNNGLSLVFLLLFVIALTGQLFSGHEDNNKERKEQGQRPLSVSEYIYSGHFIQATFENWESEFLQMALLFY